MSKENENDKDIVEAIRKSLQKMDSKADEMYDALHEELSKKILDEKTSVFSERKSDIEDKKEDDSLKLTVDENKNLMNDKAEDSSKEIKVSDGAKKHNVHKDLASPKKKNKLKPKAKSKPKRDLSDVSIKSTNNTETKDQLKQDASSPVASNDDAKLRIDIENNNLTTQPDVNQEEEIIGKVEQIAIDVEKRFKGGFVDDLKFFAVFFTLFALFRFFAYDYYMIPSSSMVPTLLIGDMPFVDKWVYGYSKHSVWFSPNLFSGRRFFNNKPKRGEVVVFKAPEDNDTNVIKRLIAVPGDKISVSNGVICVNGKTAELVFRKKMRYNDYNTRSQHELSLFSEKLPCSSAPEHIVAYDDNKIYSDANHFPEIVVPEGYYFVMGDNRDYSKDSRCGLGMVPEENLMGKALFTIYSIDNGVKLWEFWLWVQNIRFDRMLKRII